MSELFAEIKRHWLLAGFFALSGILLGTRDEIARLIKSACSRLLDIQNQVCTSQEAIADWVTIVAWGAIGLSGFFVFVVVVGIASTRALARSFTGNKNWLVARCTYADLAHISALSVGQFGDASADLPVIQLGPPHLLESLSASWEQRRATDRLLLCVQTLEGWSTSN